MTKMKMTKIKKAAAVLLTGVVLSGAAGYSALATPDEWIPARGPYLDPGIEAKMPAGAGPASQYVVRQGDTLLAIAGRFGVRAGDLAAVNNLRDADLIREGQVLLIPGSIHVHTVIPGETLSGIARKFGVPVKDIAAANGLKNEDLVLAGQKLIIARGEGSRGGLPAGPASRGLPVGELEWPVIGWISSPFGMRDGKPHEGIDIAADHGTPIRAAMAGRVVFAGPRGGYGLTVILDHGEGVSTVYAHSSRILVAEGEWVAKGQVIALVGNTGKSKGPHLHLELHLDGTPFDPLICLGRIYA